MPSERVMELFVLVSLQRTGRDVNFLQLKDGGIVREIGDGSMYLLNSVSSLANECIFIF